MNKSDTAASSVAPHMTPAEARIDWSLGRVIGFSVPADVDAAFDVVQLLLDGQCVNTAVANLSVFELARDLLGCAYPREKTQPSSSEFLKNACCHRTSVRCPCA
ncbi:hypothetical protein [Ideonella paludis]|uniref:hypothetical protein n=1 Tax=Ideonella paludis TaxID=1233411 RepID=UPI00363C8B37